MTTTRTTSASITVASTDQFMNARPAATFTEQADADAYIATIHGHGGQAWITTQDRTTTVASDLLVGDSVRLGNAWRSVRYLVTCLSDRTQTVITADGGEYELSLDAEVTYRP